MTIHTFELGSLLNGLSWRRLLLVDVAEFKLIHIQIISNFGVVNAYAKLKEINLYFKTPFSYIS